MLNNNAFLQVYSYAINNPFYRHWPCMYVIACVSEREGEGNMCVCVSENVCVCERESVCVCVTNVGENPNEGGRYTHFHMLVYNGYQ